MLEDCTDRERGSISKGLKNVLGAKVDVDSAEVKLLGADGGTGLELCLFLFSDHSAWLLSREACNEGEGDPPLYVNVNMFSGQLMNTWIDSLQAFFPGLQVFHNSICSVKEVIGKGSAPSFLFMVPECSLAPSDLGSSWHSMCPLFSSKITPH